MTKTKYLTGYDNVLKQMEIIIFTLEALQALWNAMYAEIEDKADKLPPHVHDLLVQLECLVKEDPTANLNRVKDAMFIAKALIGVPYDFRKKEE